MAEMIEVDITVVTDTDYGIRVDNKGVRMANDRADPPLHLIAGSGEHALGWTIHGSPGDKIKIVVFVDGVQAVEIDDKIPDGLTVWSDVGGFNV